MSPPAEQLDGDEFQDVLIHGHIDSVCKAHELVRPCSDTLNMVYRTSIIHRECINF